MKIGTFVFVPIEGTGLTVGEPYMYQPPEDSDFRSFGEQCFDTEPYLRIRIMFSHGTFEIDCDDVEVLSESR